MPADRFAYAIARSNDPAGQWQAASHPFRMHRLHRDPRGVLRMHTSTVILQRLQDELMRRLAVLDTAAKQSHRIHHLDFITCLPDRHCFDRLLASHLQITPAPTGLLLIDIEHLKLINDAKGRTIGDKVVAEIASRLRGIGTRTAAFRLNGDGFAVIIRDCRNQQHLDAVANKVLTAMARPLGGFQDVLPRVTIGGALIGNVYLDPGMLRRNANLALCHAKETMRGGYVAFERRLSKDTARRMRSLRLVEAALASDSLVPHYQPVVNIRTGQTVGVEALARVIGAGGQVVPAEEFHSALQDPSVSVRVTDRMLGRIAEDFRAHLDSGGPFQHVGINLSLADLTNADLSERLARTFGDHGVPLGHLVLEVTETVYLDGNSVGIAAEIRKLRDQGLLVALDDFGTGYASLKHLQSFPVDIVKIDKSFVRDLPSDRSSVAIVEGLIGIANRMGMKVVAEGIETTEQADFLRNAGCTLGQGYLFGKPVPANQAAQRIVDNAPPVDARDELVPC
ncbi:putative bifunctional diguanylate cyclase/phosphodiesterase [Aureimonas leprariae]|uniref:EAL domain-containing protein n=1 Tax=Plantimonas leprariae TaxID=2615207 RepID=A0A7V7PMG3_9HYPH|nr:GGDEF domain-containing phosphodiesterase [Aureimonas leprariae]KAB0678077.1 EAL domain-containing protein [Aureimonas leprariae]